MSLDLSKAKVTTSTFGQEEIEIICYAEQLYWAEGVFPSPEAVASGMDCSIELVKSTFDREEFKATMDARGIPLEPSEVLTPMQLLAANLILNLYDERTVRQKLKQVGVKPNQYMGWLGQPAFQQYLQRRSEELFKTSDHDVYRALSKAAGEGDVNAIKLYMEVRGIYNPKMTINVNVETVMVQVVEVIAKHVQDQNVIDAVATDLQQIGAAANPAPL